MLDKKQIRVIFLFKFKMSGKAAEITHNINKAVGPGFDKKKKKKKVQCSGGSRSFAKKRRVLKMKSTVAGHVRGSSKLILLQPHKKLPSNSTFPILLSFGI